ncbi:MAG: hypothetical protein ABIS50_19160 [Luteolibacter sp.]|uniref:hypothetical protein n=1 Tax=Luteolibacter sp. TaxID=1962973 RepID=UPI003263114D
MKLILLIATLFIPVVQGKDVDDVLVSCRFLGFEPAKDGTTSLVAPGKDGKPETIALTMGETLSKPVVLKSEQGMITFRKGESDTAAAATAKIPAGTKDAIILFIPTEKEGLILETLVVDSSAKAFPPGNSIVVNHCPQKAKITMGEHVIDIKPDESVAVARPKEIDEFNMVNVKSELETDGTWRIASESNIRFVQTQRNLFVMHIDAETKRPRFWFFQE